MATQRKRVNASKGHKNMKASRKGAHRNSVHTGKNQKGQKTSSYEDEIILVVTLVFSLLLILSNFNLSGKVGDAINYITFGIMGYLAYFLPFVLFFSIAFYIANRGSKKANAKLISIISLGFILASFIQLFSFEYDNHTNLIYYFRTSAIGKNGGGIIGGTICKILYPLFDKIGTFIILIGLMIVCVMFITGKALLLHLGGKGKASIHEMKENRAQRMEDNNQEMKRRPAKIFTLNKNQQQKTAETTDSETTDSESADKINSDKINSDKINSNKTNSDTKMGNSLFKKKQKFDNSVQMDLPLTNMEKSIDMEEIIPNPLNNITIQRANSYQDEVNGADKSTYADNSLNGKDAVNNLSDKERQKLDNDINRLLKAAGEDVDSYPLVNDLKQDEVNHQSKDKPSELGPSTNKQNLIIKEKLNETETLNINQEVVTKKDYIFPPVDLLTKPRVDAKGMTDKDLQDTAIKLQKTLDSFGVRVTITNVSCGPAVTRYELQPEQGVKVSRITGLADDIKLNLAAADVRIEAPIPGKAAVGIEVPNKENTMVTFRELIESKEFKKHSSDIAFAVGKDIGGQTIVTDIAKMPHLLIAGATGSGKSVCINTIIMSILYKAKPEDVRLIMVDPKVVELSVYNGIPHLLVPVVTDPKKASAALNWAVMEMTERYKKFADLGVRDIKGYNEKVATVEEYNDERYQKLPQIVIIVDELADLMMVAPGEVEDAICRLAQMARAAGLHLIIATQRPSVNVITGLIKANVPSRIAFSVSSAIDSRTIIDGSGAEKLLGKGDMLFFPSGYPKPVRVQGAFVSDKEVSSVVEFLKEQNADAEYSEDIAQKITSAQAVDNSSSAPANDRDEYFIEAGKFIIEKDKASIGMLQRVYKIGFNRAARIMDQLSEAGVVGPEEGTKPRKVLMSLEEFEQYVDEYV